MKAQHDVFPRDAGRDQLLPKAGVGAVVLDHGLDEAADDRARTV
jgi:hypothetical protein